MIANRYLQGLLTGAFKSFIILGSVAARGQKRAKLQFEIFALA
jgi:hypothetical protein